jgi:hypothetical protein
MGEAKLACFLFAQLGVVLAQRIGNGALILRQLRADVLKARQRLDAAQTVFFRDRLLQIGCHKRLDDHATRSVLRIQNPALEKRSDPVVGHERTNLVAGQQSHFVVDRADCDTHPVAIRIGRDHEIGDALLRQLHAQPQGRGVLRVWRCHRREISVEAILFLDHGEIEP